jgi:biotin operon repressor
MDTAELFKCFADKTRIQIINLLSKEDSYVEIMANKLSLTPATISFHLKKLESAGLVTSRRNQFYIMYSLNKEILNKTLAEMIITNEEPDIQKQREKAYRDLVIASFFKDGKLKSIPVQLKKREVILKEILKSFEPVRKYTEKEVNLIISDFHDDFCTIRREMIAFQFMRRDKGIYWVNTETSK